MSSASAVKALSLFIELTQLAANVGLSMQDLVDRQKQAEIEGREFGAQDLKEMRDQVDANLDELEQQLSE